MRLIFIALGSRGDVQPIALLAQEGLRRKKRGTHTYFITHRDHKDLCFKHWFKDFACFTREKDVGGNEISRTKSETTAGIVFVFLKSHVFLKNKNQNGEVLKIPTVFNEWIECRNAISQLSCFAKSKPVMVLHDCVAICNHFAFPGVIDLFQHNLNNLFIIAPCHSNCIRIPTAMRSSVEDILARFRRKSDETAIDQSCEAFLRHQIEVYLWILFTNKYDQFCSLVGNNQLPLQLEMVFASIHSTWRDGMKPFPHFLFANGSTEPKADTNMEHLLNVGFIMEEDLSPEGGCSRIKKQRLFDDANSLLGNFLIEKLADTSRVVLLNFGSMSSFVNWKAVFQMFDSTLGYTFIILVSVQVYTLHDLEENVCSQKWNVHGYGIRNRVAEENSCRSIFVGSYSFSKLFNLVQVAIAPCNDRLPNESLTKDRKIDLDKPRVVLIHHGGSGTTACASRHGIQQLIYPMAYDQHYWTKFVKEQGFGIELQSLTPKALKSALDTLVNSQPRGGEDNRTQHLKLGSGINPNFHGLQTAADYIFNTAAGL